MYRIEPKPILVATQLTIGNPTEEHTGRVTIAYVLRTDANQHCDQGNLEFEAGDEAKAVLADPAAAVGARLGLHLLDTAAPAAKVVAAAEPKKPKGGKGSKDTAPAATA